MGEFHMGINMGHDRSVAVVKDGQLIVAIEQERLDRFKHSVGFMLQAPEVMGQIQVPGEAIRYCLDDLEIPLQEMATITANMPGIDLAPNIIRGKFSREIAGQVQTIPSHHLAHAYSAYWNCGFDEALVLVADASGTTSEGSGGRQTESYTLYTGHGTEIEPIHSETIKAHLAGLSTLGFVYEAISCRAGFVTRLKSGLNFPEAGKLMGLAAFGNPQSNWEKWLRTDPGSLQLGISAYDIALEVAALQKRYDDGAGKPYFRPWLVDLAYKVQTELEEALCHLVEEAQARTGLNKLCIAGGVGLNSVANYSILKRCALDDIFIFPAAADNGIAAGCALWAYHKIGGGTRRPPFESAFLGRSYSEDEVELAIDQLEDLLNVEKLDDASMCERTAEALANGHIVARFEGGSEFGPRALGHRSILADPTFERMKDVVNARVKFREAFRPFAPFVPLERANEVFELETASPHMLLVAPVREELRQHLPAITHEDGTGRVQTCTLEENPFFYNLCLAAERHRSGPPVLLNTSFNIAGQPIVENPQEAIETFLRTDIDFLSLGDRWICRRHQPVKDYQDHILDLQSEPKPAGLPPQQPSVLPLMRELDSAVFMGKESTHWSRKEIEEFSAEAARFKETSKLFTETPFVAPLLTQLGANAVLILDPRGGSVLVDETGRQPQKRLDLTEVQMLLALLEDPESMGTEFRLALGATPLEVQDLADEMLELLDQFQIPSHAGWRTLAEDPNDSLVTDFCGKTLECFSDESFQCTSFLKQFRGSLHAQGYRESKICDLLQVDSLQSIEATHLHYLNSHALPETPLADLVRLFLLRGEIPRKLIEDILGEEVLETLERLLLIRSESGNSRAAVDLFCCDRLLFITDHRYMIRSDDRLDEDPVMYLGMDSHGLVQTAPRNLCERVLDLCCGSGVQGIVASRYCEEVVAVDLNPRAIRFARFNAQLNGIEGYRVVEGDLYQPVSGERFDVIIANPPFVPSPEESLKFRDGGSSGERILRSIVVESVNFLTPSGRLCIVSDLVDVDSYQEKLRKWLADRPSHSLLLTTADRDEILFSVPHCHAPFSQPLEEYNQELSRWVDNFRKERIEAVNFGYILVWNSEEKAACDITRRTIHNPSSPMWAQVEDWIIQRRLWESDQAADRILALHPDLRVRTEKGPGGDAPVHELTVNDNSFFTTYTVGTEMLSELQRIFQVEPELSRRLTPLDQQWLEDLHRKGLLRLNLTRRNTMESAPAHPGSGSSEVLEKATKTTPTCLSSFLG